MKEQHFKPITTRIGILTGRDAIYLNATFYEGGDLVMEGSINGRPVSIPTDDHIFLSADILRRFGLEND